MDRAVEDLVHTIVVRRAYVWGIAQFIRLSQTPWSKQFWKAADALNVSEFFEELGDAIEHSRDLLDEPAPWVTAARETLSKRTLERIKNRVQVRERTEREFNGGESRG